ncbi:MAG: glycosyltransferase family 2 protein [Gammaproteobacteria bacterium]|jgi:glycosyltransferase involved in cell wall biosynthesis|nr:glycosyltransferase family 2 protein [Gammaproteobacteria bacterium]MBT3724207.1 glycosyltransferase family 2 protein [Gammaproteobacteria bacterium]MBT4195755.1 glycosyltransferase family 2 protein [Gammaproteobacteria bacterium]MBT4450247.1 glycosyltransferase family 2 protein [Gammaproteobacteria bacterium]MBT4860817.1 glycosyltransferase family 2 protein [Gammaproteobacteria bacterium]
MTEKNMSKLISILVPCFNEQDSISGFMATISPVLESLQENVEILFIDDGSTDETLKLLSRLAGQNQQVKVISFSRNFGKEAALTAGLDLVTGDAVIPIDVDLQDPVELIPQMIEKWKAGADVVLARRLDRPSDSFIKRLAVNIFYKLISFLSSTPIPRDVGDYRLMDRKVVDSICLLPERNRFMKGILSWPGYETEVIDFSRPDRATGRSKWRSWKLFNYALDGIFSFSTAPLRMWTYAGLVLSFFSLCYLIFIVAKTLIFGVDLPGYASVVSIILFFSGINLVGLGILGEYLGRVFIEVKQRPVYLIKRKIGFD